MICLDFDWQIDEFMLYCRSTQLRPQTMKSHEQTLRLLTKMDCSYYSEHRDYVMKMLRELCC